MRALEFLIPGNPDALTGGYLYDLHIASGLRARGWQVTVHGLDASFPTPTPAALSAARALLAAQPDGALVLIDGLALGGLAAALAEQRTRLRLVALVHHPLALETGLGEHSRAALYNAERGALQSARRVIVTSRWTRQALADYAVADACIGVVEPGTRQAQARAGAAGRPHRLLCVASLTPRKGHAWLLDALAKLPREQWRLECIGSPDMDRTCAAALRAQIDALGLRAQVCLRGEVDPADLPACYTQADTFVLASFMEGYGMVLSEALAAGLPIVSTQAGAIPHVVPAAACLLVPPGDGAALQAALLKVLDGGAVWQQLAQGALAASAALPSWADAVQRFEAELAAVP
jgi:glycosyltransferase involved in cell wall biosynthesis